MGDAGKISERIETGLLLLNKGTGCGENSAGVCLFSKSVSQGAVQFSERMKTSMTILISVPSAG